jgi:putrescine transport system substrate-binding protein
MWGTTGIGINVDKVKERLGDLPLNSWDLLLKPQLVEKLKDCGVYMLDAPEDVFPGVLRYLGSTPILQEAGGHHQGRRSSDEGARAWCASSTRPNTSTRSPPATSASPSAIRAMCCRPETAGPRGRNGVKIDYLIPREGALMWFDSFAMPPMRPTRTTPMRFLDFMMRPDVAARNSNMVSYASGNLAAKAEIRKDILDNPNIYPDAATFARLFTNTAYDDKIQKVVTRQWTRVKTGK